MAKCGVYNGIENPLLFSRRYFSIPHYFCSLVSWKKYRLRLVEIELFVQFCPHFANTFSVMCKLTKATAKKKS